MQFLLAYIFIKCGFYVYMFAFINIKSIATF